MNIYNNDIRYCQMKKIVIFQKMRFIRRMYIGMLTYYIVIFNDRMRVILFYHNRCVYVGVSQYKIMYDNIPFSILLVFLSGY